MRFFTFFASQLLHLYRRREHQHLILKEISAGAQDANADIQAASGSSFLNIYLMSHNTINLLLQNFIHLRCIIPPFPFYLADCKLGDKMGSW